MISPSSSSPPLSSSSVSSKDISKLKCAATSLLRRFPRLPCFTFLCLLPELLSARVGQGRRTEASIFHTIVPYWSLWT
jgi:hypothetical protein